MRDTIFPSDHFLLLTLKITECPSRHAMHSSLSNCGIIFLLGLITVNDYRKSHVQCFANDSSILKFSNRATVSAYIPLRSVEAEDNVSRSSG
jgi:hypothetical protein